MKAKFFLAVRDRYRCALLTCKRRPRQDVEDVPDPTVRWSYDNSTLDR